MRVIALATAVLLLAGCSSAGQATQERKGQTGFVAGGGTLTVFAPQDRKPAPKVSGETLDGAPWSLQDQAGKVVVLNVWGSWC
ncbi:MAG: TlpA family protein disulfide reductase, partial [Kribbellaceae bacterium]